MRLLKRYRLVKVTKVNGFTLWVIQKRFLFWWEFADSYIHREAALDSLIKLRGGMPLERREVVKDIPQHVLD